MPIPTPVILPVLASVRRQLAGDVSLAALARTARRSPSEVHRAVRRVTGETTKRYTIRLRLERAAAELLLSDRSILDIALASGFASHEVFTRAFLRHFRMSPRAYRARGLVGGRGSAKRHAAIVASAGPCIGLYHLSERNVSMSTTVVRKQLEPQLTLVIRKKTQTSQIAAALGECLPAVWAYAQQRGIALAGPPFTRYLEVGLGAVTIEAGLPIAAPAQGEGNIVASELPGGDVAVAVHVGPYDRLAETHGVVTKWLDEHQLGTRGAPWEVYVTDPGTTPNPAEWKTDVIYPIKPT